MKPIPTEANGWQFNPEACPPDQDFIEYLAMDQRVAAIRIFHLGPGIHHKVGLWAATKNNIYVRALSITPTEVVEYIRLATENPLLATKYAVDFGDIHLTPIPLLPRLDYITMFHLGEISAQLEDPDYPGSSITDTVGAMARRMSIDGQMLFYEGSSAWQSIKGAVEVNMVYKYEFEKSTYKSLTIYKKLRL